jgi:lysophospholipase L1-like esterase
MRFSARRSASLLFSALALVLTLFVPGPVRLQAELAKSAFTKEIAAFQAADATNPPPQGATLFIGSSSIRLWHDLPADFPGHAVINRGFGGSQISDVLLYLNEIVFPYHPKEIVFYAGANDIHAHKTPEQVLADFKEFVKLTHENLPGVRIDFIAITTNPSRIAETNEVRQANRMVADFCAIHPRDLLFIDPVRLMLDADGQPIPELFGPDRLHMSKAGYAIWARVVRKAVFHEGN